MNYVLVFCPEVREEFNDAHSWYESQKPGLDDEFLDCVDETVNRISQMPESYVIVYGDIRRAVVRRFPYAVYYRIVSSNSDGNFSWSQRSKIVADANLTL